MFMLLNTYVFIFSKKNIKKQGTGNGKQGTWNIKTKNENVAKWAIIYLPNKVVNSTL